ncbi:uncharacterized protein BCR38DRAFT_342441, partial [Pseudomassariella vexata]
LPPTDTATVPPTLTSSLPGSEIPTNTTDVTTSTTADITASESSAPPVTNSTMPAETSSVPVATSSLPATSVTTGDATVSVNSTTVPETSTEVPPTSTLPTSTLPLTTHSTPPPKTTTTAAPTFTSIPATATITDSESWLPSTIIIQPSSMKVSTGGLAPTSSPTGIPSGLPRAITPYDTVPEQPPNTTLAQISFLYGMNYAWLVQQPMAAAQLFSLLPQALGFGQGFDPSEAVMLRIVPYDTTSQLGYITSQALIYVPTLAFDTLRLDYKIPSARLYQNPAPLISNMTSQINPAIDIIPGSGLGDVGTVSTDPSNPTSTGNSNNDAFGTGDTSGDQTASQKGTTAAIAVGAASLAGAYGAAMFIIARRYKRKKQRHQRSSSVASPSEMRQRGSPAMMGGALLSRDFTAGSYGGVAPNTRHSQGSGRSGMNNSGRTAFISAPVAAENSLGWN